MRSVIRWGKSRQCPVCSSTVRVLISFCQYVYANHQIRTGEYCRMSRAPVRPGEPRAEAK